MKLQEVIQARKGTRTWQQVSDDAGGYPGAGRLKQLATNKPPMKDFPATDVRLGLALALNVPHTQIIAGCMEEMGLPPLTAYGSDSPALSGNVGRLTSVQLRIVNDVIDGLAHA